MQPALLIRLRPAGPWRFGPGEGGLDGVDELYRSDRLFSALTIAFGQLGLMDEWLQATAHAAKPAVAIGSLFPFQGDTLFAIPPATLWPPPVSQLTAPNSIFLAKIRWKTAHFVPLAVIDTLVTGGGLLADQWLPDPESGCLLRRDRPSSSPFRTVVRSGAAVDRLGNPSQTAVSTTCIEFEPGAGLWTVVRYRDTESKETWNSRIEAAFRFLAHSGFGGRRSIGWGHAEEPQFQAGSWPGILLPRLGRRSNGSAPATDASEGKPRYWLLSLFSPAASDDVDWRSGEYTLAVRGGRVESKKNTGVIKKSVRMVTEGSVILAADDPVGAALNVAPDDFEHPVFRSGIALALELPVIVPQTLESTVDTSVVETPAVETPAVETPAVEVAAAETEIPAKAETLEPETPKVPETEPEPVVPEPPVQEPPVPELPNSDPPSEEPPVSEPPAEDQEESVSLESKETEAHAEAPTAAEAEADSSSVNEQPKSSESPADEQKDSDHAV
jgi:CRISPR type III-A-associated RAMP protein Csm4